MPVFVLLQLYRLNYLPDLTIKSIRIFKNDKMFLNYVK